MNDDSKYIDLEGEIEELKKECDKYKAELEHEKKHVKQVVNEAIETCHDAAVETEQVEKELEDVKGSFEIVKTAKDCSVELLELHIEQLWQIISKGFIPRLSYEIPDRTTCDRMLEATRNKDIKALEQVLEIETTKETP